MKSDFIHIKEKKIAYYTRGNKHNALSENGLCEVIVDCGHYVPEEQPQSLLLVFKKFLQSVHLGS
ncbi:hypothetical protein [Albibacterium sp.]|uniref:hypothetical protein n=1 Tax=Albibacterium sp. TaxID=2952885 RepID=UPI002D0EA375|nr:hypothetical protein [Albibacterium sp.]HUH18767.1 hypothetical protein [Albibacterium sp.]